MLYGAAEFSRDCDIVILANEENLRRLQSALNELQANCIAVPPFEKQYLDRGHAVHFRCNHPHALNMRIDVMTKMRGCDDFDSLWSRRFTLEDSDGSSLEILGIEDLILAKKTQRDKDWPMIRRLVDAHYDRFQHEPNDERVRFWLRECRTPAVLISLVQTYPNEARASESQRQLITVVRTGTVDEIRSALEKEKDAVRKDDEAYWEPLKKELEQLRIDRQEG